MAYTYVPPRKVEANPLLQGATMTFKYLNDFNQKRNEQMQARMDNIFKLANQLDYVSTISAENKRMQNAIYTNLVDGLTKITEDYSDRRGNISNEGRLQKQLLFREAAAQINQIAQNEKTIMNIDKAFAKDPMKYDPDTYIKAKSDYINKGIINEDALTERPVYPRSWMSDIDFDYKISTEYEEGDYLVKKTMGMTPEERDEKYMQNITESDGKKKGMILSYMDALKNNKDNAKNYPVQQYGGLENAALEWGRKELAQKYIGPDKYDKNLIDGGTEGKIYTINPTEREDDNVVIWDAGAKAQTYSGKIKTIDGTEQTVMNAKITKPLIIDKKTGQRYTEVVANVKSSLPEPEPTGDKTQDALNQLLFSLQKGGTQTKSYLIPFDTNKEMVTSRFNLGNIENYKNITPVETYDDKTLKAIESFMKTNNINDQKEAIKILQKAGKL